MKNTAAVLPEPDLRRCDKSCSRCGAIRKRPLFKATKWKCEKCKTIHDRKSNSKANIDTFYRNAIAIHYGWIPFGPQAVHNPQLRAAILYFCDEVFRKLVEGLELAVPRPPLGGPVPFIFPSHPPGRVEQILHEPRRNTLDTLKDLTVGIARAVETRDAPLAAYLALFAGQIACGLALYESFEISRRRSFDGAKNARKKNVKQKLPLETRNSSITHAFKIFTSETGSHSVRIFCDWIPEYLERVTAEDPPLAKILIAQKITGLGPRRIGQILNSGV